MNVLVSGSTGFVGETITRHLLEAGHTVRALSRSIEKAIAEYDAHKAGRQALGDGRLVFVEADITKPATLATVVEGVEAVIQAAQFRGAPVENPARGLTYQEVDRDGTVNLLEAIASLYGPSNPVRRGTSSVEPDSSLPRFIYVSGITVAAEAQEPWNRAKWEAEEAIRHSGLAWTIVRCCWAYGPGDKALNRILGYSDYLPFVPIFGRGRKPLTPLYVEDIGRLFVSLLANPDKDLGTLLRLGGPDTVDLQTFLREALAAMGRRRPILPIPVPVGKAAASLLQHLPGRVLTPAAVDFASQGGAVTDADRQFLAERFPSYATTSLRAGLTSFLGR